MVLYGRLCGHVGPPISPTNVPVVWALGFGPDSSRDSMHLLGRPRRSHPSFVTSECVQRVGEFLCDRRVVGGRPDWVAVCGADPPRGTAAASARGGERGV